MNPVERWRKVPVAVAVDVSKGACQIDPAIRPLRPAGQQPRLFGFAVTAICAPPDFGAVLRAIDLVKPGDVLVIDAQGNRDFAMIGEILGGHLRRLGAAGVVCEGAIRDVAELAGWDTFSAFSRFITPRGPIGATGTRVNQPAVIGGRTVNAGDLLIGDDDGLCALTPDMIRMLIDLAEAKLAAEKGWQDKLASGQSIAATFGLET
jgi:4-hydroxy-4-methyl-2-oxoglutarate aldolase